MTDRVSLSADGISLAVTALGGMLADLTISRAGASIRPLHRAPWVGDGAGMPESAPPHLGVLEGDFFCAPFGGGGAGVPTHGWPANGVWTETSRGTGADGRLEAVFALDHAVLGASVEKRVALMPGHPVVYQTHVLRGGEGRLPIAHHAMIHVPGGARLSFSPKLFGATPGKSLEHGRTDSRFVLRYPQRFEDLAEVRLESGGAADLTVYPYGERHEDFATLFDPPGTAVGWSAAVAERDGFLFFALKDARLLPQTSLWMSDGGRDYAPWNGRHRAVLGIEESCTHFGDGLAVSAADNDLTREGLATSVALRPGGELTVRYALGAIPVPAGFSRVADIVQGDGEIAIADRSGARVCVPFDTAFLHGRQA